MISWSRLTLVRPGRMREAAAFAAEVVPLVTSATGRSVRLYAAMAGVPVGTLVWAIDHDSLESWSQTFDASAADERIAEALAGAREIFEPGATDHVHALVHAAGETAPGHQIVESLGSRIARGKGRAAMAWSTEVTDYAANLVGLGVGCFVPLYDRWNEVQWRMAYPDGASLDMARAKFASDPGYAELLDKAAFDELFEGAGQGALFRRL